MAESGGRRNGRPAQGGRTEIKPRRFPMATRKRQPGRAAAFAFHTAIPDRGHADRLGDFSCETTCNRAIHDSTFYLSSDTDSFRRTYTFSLYPISLRTDFPHFGARASPESFPAAFRPTARTSRRRKATMGESPLFPARPSPAGFPFLTGIRTKTSPGFQAAARIRRPYAIAYGR